MTPTTEQPNFRTLHFWSLAHVADATAGRLDALLARALTLAAGEAVDGADFAAMRRAAEALALAEREMRAAIGGAK